MFFCGAILSSYITLEFLGGKQPCSIKALIRDFLSRFQINVWRWLFACRNLGIRTMAGHALLQRRFSWELSGRKKGMLNLLGMFTGFVVWDGVAKFESIMWTLTPLQSWNALYRTHICYLQIIWTYCFLWYQKKCNVHFTCSIRPFRLPFCGILMKKLKYVVVKPCRKTAKCVFATQRWTYLHVEMILRYWWCE